MAAIDAILTRLEVRRPSRRQRQHLRRHVPAVRAGPPQVRPRLHLRRYLAARPDRAGDHRRRPNTCSSKRRPTRCCGSPTWPRRADIAHRAQRPRHRRQHVRQPLHPAAARARLRHRRPQHDEVPQRPQRQRRRRRRAEARGRRRVDEVRAERGGRHPRADGLVAGAARHQDAADPHGAHQRQRAWPSPSISPGTTKVKSVIYPGLADHPHHALAKKQMRGLRRADLVRRRLARRGARRSCRASS